MRSTTRKSCDRGNRGVMLRTFVKRNQIFAGDATVKRRKDLARDLASQKRGVSLRGAVVTLTDLSKVIMKQYSASKID